MIRGKNNISLVLLIDCRHIFSQVTCHVDFYCGKALSYLLLVDIQIVCACDGICHCAGEDGSYQYAKNHPYDRYKFSNNRAWEYVSIAKFGQNLLNASTDYWLHAFFRQSAKSHFFIDLIVRKKILFMLTLCRLLVLTLQMI